MYKFTSPRQLIFKIFRPSGQQALVCFSERDMNGVSTFLTDEESTAKSIMNHSFFKKGVIALAEAPAKEAETAAEKTTEDLNDEAIDEAEGSQEQTTEEETTTETTTTDVEIPEDGVMKFPNITIAKDYLHRTFGVKKEEIRSLPKVLAYAESKGITIVIGD